MLWMRLVDFFLSFTFNATVLDSNITFGEHFWEIDQRNVSQNSLKFALATTGWNRDGQNTWDYNILVVTQAVWGSPSVKIVAHFLLKLYLILFNCCFSSSIELNFLTTKSFVRGRKVRFDSDPWGALWGGNTHWQLWNTKFRSTPKFASTCDL